MLEQSTVAFRTEGENWSHLLSTGSDPSCDPVVLAAAAKEAAEVPVGHGLPAIPKRLHERVLV